jgi:hypothetical protein
VQDTIRWHTEINILINVIALTCEAQSITIALELLGINRTQQKHRASANGVVRPDLIRL